jgi:hypothetical protein
MRYVAVSLPDAAAPIQILGVGESMDDAFAGARAWFDTAFANVDSETRRWRELFAMQNNLDAVPESVLQEKTGVSLDDWLVRLASAGLSPGTSQPPKPWRDVEISRKREGWDRSDWILAGIIFLGPTFLSYILSWFYVWDRRLPISPETMFLYICVGLVIQTIVAVIEFKFVQYFFDRDLSLRGFLMVYVLYQLASFAFGLATVHVGLLGFLV